MAKLILKPINELKLRAITGGGFNPIGAIKRGFRHGGHTFEDAWKDTKKDDNKKKD